MGEYHPHAVREYTLTVEAESESAARQYFIDAMYEGMTVESDAVVSVVEVDSVPVVPRPWWEHWEDGASREYRGLREDDEAERHRREQWGD